MGVSSCDANFVIGSYDVRSLRELALPSSRSEHELPRAPFSV